MLAAAIASGVSIAVGEDEIHVGRSAAGQLVVHADIPAPIVLPASIFSGITGYATGEVGMHTVSFDEPDEDIFQVSTAARFQFVLLSKDHGVEVWNDTGSGFMNVGEAYRVGQAPFDVHPVWNIVNGTPGQSYSLTMKFQDVNGVHSESAPFVMSFTPVPYALNISPVETSRVALSWPTNAIGWELQFTQDLAATNWTTITNVLQIAGTNFSVSVPSGDTQKFFRLCLK
jgi:hypothetical protein